MHFLIIGVGSIGERHLRNFLRIAGVRCSFAEVNPTTRDKMAATYKVEQVYADFREADLTGFDGVVICVPANLHVPIASEVALAGTHVLTEKPLSMSLDGIDQLKQLRDEQGVVVSVAFPFRSEPMFVELKERVASQELGAIHLVNSFAGQYWPSMRKDYPPQYAQSRASGGGAIPDHLVHHINFLEWVFGQVKDVSAMHWRLALDDIATEETSFVTLRFGSGPIAHLGICLFQRDQNTRMQIIGDRGTVQMRSGIDTLEIFDAASDQWSPGRTCASDRDDLFRDQAQHFIDCIHNRATPRCTVEEAEQTLRTVLAALDSADGNSAFVSVDRT